MQIDLKSIRHRPFTIDSAVHLVICIFIIIALIPVWSNAWFITGDGPTHLYNAQILHDLYWGDNVDFYKHFFSVNPAPEPNWMSHFLLVVFLSVTSAAIAEKLLVTIYIISFVTGLWYVFNAINPKNKFLVVLGLPFVFTHTFQMGFYNYSLSIALFFIGFAYWYRHRNRLTVGRALILAGFGVILYFTHPIGWGLWAGSVCSVLFFGLATKASREQGAAVRNGLSAVGRLLLILLPSVLLIFNYLLRKGLNPTARPESETMARLWLEFRELRSLITLSGDEVFWATCLAITFGVIFTLAIRQRLRGFALRPADGMLLMFLLTLIIYFFQPGSIAGAGILPVRLQFLPYLMALLWIASISIPPKMQWGVLAVATICTTVMQVSRIHRHDAASKAVERYLDAAPHIDSHSTVLPLSFDHGRLFKTGEPIATRIWLFIHISGYLGNTKPLVILDNYEANLGYFPLKWRQDKSPYLHLNVGPGMEHQPPQVDIQRYERTCDALVDYVLLSNLETDDTSDPVVSDMLGLLEVGYEQVYVSADKQVSLYKRISNE